MATTIPSSNASAQDDAVRGTLAFLSYVFNELPTEEFLGRLGAVPLDVDDGTVAEVCRAAASYDSLEAAMLDVAKDRARLLRALSKEGPKPPYESQYSGKPMEVLYGEIFSHHRRAGVHSDDRYGERPDYLGAELAFLSELVKKECVALEAGDASAAVGWREQQSAFFTDHLHRWVVGAAGELERCAHTDFYRAIGHLLREFDGEYAVYLSR